MGHIFPKAIGAMLGLFFVSLAQASPLVDIKTGTSSTSEARLRLGKILVFTEDGCSACAAYTKTLLTCPLEIRNRVEFVSVSSPSKTKQMIRKQKLTGPVYIIDSIKGSGVVGTPTTMLGSFSQLGSLSCEFLQTQVSNENL